MTDPAPTYVVTLTPTTDPLDREPTHRLRAALKRLLRTYGLRCTSAIELHEPEAIKPTTTD